MANQPPRTFTQAELHYLFVLIKDRMNINDAKDPESFIKVFQTALDQAKAKMCEQAPAE